MVSCGLIWAISASLWSMVRRFLRNRQWKIRFFEWWKRKVLLNVTLRPREFRDIHYSERDIGVLWIPQHRQKLTNTTPMQVKSTKHRHRSTLFNQWFNVYTCYLYLNNFPQNKHITTLPLPGLRVDTADVLKVENSFGLAAGAQLATVSLYLLICEICNCKLARL